MLNPGTLYIVATPIGNLKDITLRALEVLRAVDVIACEDTRHTRKLLTHYDISTPTISYFSAKERRKAETIITLLKNGKHIAVVSDAGTPGVSDPGYVVIKRATQEGITLVPIPGANAAITGLIVSGLPMEAFIFEGFLSHKGAQRRKKLESLKNEKRTIIFYESPHRIIKTITDMLTIYGDIEVVVIKELTKIYETILRQKLSAHLTSFAQNPPKGEFLIIYNLR